MKHQREAFPNEQERERLFNEVEAAATGRKGTVIPPVVLSPQPPAYGAPQRDAIASVIDGVVREVAETLDALIQRADELKNQLLISADTAKHTLSTQVDVCAHIRDEVKRLGSMLDETARKIGA